MTRDLAGRVEAMVPIEDALLKAELRTLLDLQLADRRSAWDMQPDGVTSSAQPKRRTYPRNPRSLTAPRLAKQ